MEDRLIIDLFFQRSERAIAQTQEKYGRMLCTIAYGILRDREDAKECENDTYLKTWNSIPPAKPQVFSAFLSKITRNLSLDRYDEKHAAKRGGGEFPLLLDELAECLPDERDPYRAIEEAQLTDQINVFLTGLSRDARNIFLRRYWFGDTLQEISEETGFGLSKVKMSLLRSRKELKKVLEKEGRAL